MFDEFSVTMNLRIFHETKAKVFYNFNYVNVIYSVKNSTLDCKYLLLLQDFFLDSNQNSTKNANIADCLKNPS